MSSTSHPHARRVTAALAVVLPVLVAVLVTAFAWPAARSEPYQVPVAVVAPPDQVPGLVGALGGVGEDYFDVDTLSDRAAASEAIEDRVVYGALVATREGLELLIASGASPTVAQVLTSVAERVGEQAGAQLTVTDLVPTTAEDPRAAGLAAGSLPLVLAGIVIAVVVSFRVGRPGAQLATAVTAAALSGVGAVLVLDPWLGAISGGFWAAAGVVASGIAAMTATLLGLRSLLGLPGLASGAAVLLLLGNPLSGMTSAPELLPSGWGALGQLLPPGAMGSALRAVSFFDGVAIGTELLVLAAWFTVGLALVAVAAARGRVATDSASGSVSPVTGTPA